MKRFAILLVVLAACSKDQPPEPTSTSTPTVATTPSSSAASSAKSVASKAEPNDVGYDAPAAWTKLETKNAMRKATYKIGADTELAVSSAGGGVDPNVKRWAGQFGGATPKTEKRKVNGLDVTIVEIHGSYASGGMGMGGGGYPTPKDKWMLLGAIVDLGETQTFFKMVGPESVVTGARADFEKLVSSFRGT